MLNFIGAFLPVAAVSGIVLYFTLTLLTVKLGDFAGTLSIRLSGSFLSFQKKLSGIFFQEEIFQKRALYLLSFLPQALAILSFAALCIYLLQLISSDRGTAAAVLYTSDDMALWQRLSGVFADPAGTVLFILAVFSALHASLSLLKRKSGMNDFPENFKFISVQLGFFLMMLFVEEWMPFRIFDQELKAGSGAGRNSLSPVQFSSLLLFFSGSTGMLFFFLQKKVTQELFAGIGKNYFSIPVPLFLFALSISAYLDFFILSRTDSEVFAYFEKKDFILSLLAFSAGISLFISEIMHTSIFFNGKDFFRKALLSAIIASSIRYLEFPELLNLFISAGIVFLLIKSLVSLFLFLRTNKPDAALQTVTEFLLPLILFMLFLLYSISSMWNFCADFKFAGCSVGILPGWYFTAAFILFSVFFVLSAVSAETVRKAYRNKTVFFLLIALSAALTAGAVILFSGENPRPDAANILMYYVFPFSAILISGIWKASLLSGAEKMKSPGAMALGITFIFRELILNFRKYASELISVSAVFLAASVSGYFLSSSEEFRFQFYLSSPVHEYQDYVQYRSEDKFYFNGYEISPGTAFVFSDFYDQGSPKNLNHMIVSQELQAAVHLTSVSRSPGTDVLPLPSFFESEEGYFNEFSGLTPEGKLSAHNRFLPIVDSFAGELQKHDSGGTMRKHVRTSGILLGVVDGLLLNIEGMHAKHDLDINHLYEYYRYYTDHSLEFYSGVFPERISVSLSVQSMPWHIFYYISLILLIFAFGLLSLGIGKEKGKE